MRTIQYFFIQTNRCDSRIGEAATLLHDRPLARPPDKPAQHNQALNPILGGGFDPQLTPGQALLGNTASAGNRHDTTAYSGLRSSGAGGSLLMATCSVCRTLLRDRMLWSPL